MTRTLKYAARSAIAVVAIALFPAAAAGAETSMDKPKATGLRLAAPAAVAAGKPSEVVVSAVTKKGKPAKRFKGKVKLSSSDPRAVLPAPYKFGGADRGRHAFPVTFASPGSHTVTAVGAKKVTGSLTLSIKGPDSAGGSADPKPAGPQAPEGPSSPQAPQVPSDDSPDSPADPGPGAPASLSVEAPATAQAGEAIRPVVTAADASGLDLGDITSQVELSISPDGSCGPDACTATRAGRHSVTAELGSITGSEDVDVRAGAPTKLTMALQGSVTAGDRFRPTTTAADTYGNPLGDVTAQTEFSMSPDGDCGDIDCLATGAGQRDVLARYAGLEATGSIRVDVGPLSRISMSPNGATIAPDKPGMSNADFQPTRQTSQRYTVMGRDQMGNSLGDVTSQATVTAGGRACPGAVCTGGPAGTTQTVTARVGSATADASLNVATVDSSYTMSCRGENYDVNQNTVDGCERSQPDPGHSSKASAIDLGSKSCNDGESQTTVSGVVLSDNRTHVDPARSAGYTPPTYYKVRATGGTFCLNDMGISVRTSGGKDGGAACYRVTVNTSYYEDSGTYDGEEYREGSTGGRYYASGSDLYISIQRICNDPGPEAVDYTISFHL